MKPSFLSCHNYQLHDSREKNECLLLLMMMSDGVFSFLLDVSLFSFLFKPCHTTNEHLRCTRTRSTNEIAARLHLMDRAQHHRRDRSSKKSKKIRQTENFPFRILFVEKERKSTDVRR